MKRFLLIGLVAAMTVFAGEPPVWSILGLLPEFQRQREMMVLMPESVQKLPFKAFRSSIENTGGRRSNTEWFTP